MAGKEQIPFLPFFVSAYIIYALKIILSEI